jgi:hypothetical protein
MDAFQQALPRAYDHNWLMDFSHPHGQLIVDTDDTTQPSEYGIFSHFFDGEVLDSLVLEKNRRYATTTTCISSRGGKDELSPHSRLRRWRDVDVPEMKAFLPLLLLMGVDRRPNYSLYWTTEWTIQAQRIKSIMSRDRFYAILQMLHCTNNADLPKAG